MYQWSWRTRLRSSVRSRASVIRLGLREHPDLPIDRPHVSLSLALPRALASWGIPPTCGLRLAAYSSCLESRRWVTPFRVSICRGFRACPACTWAAPVVAPQVEPGTGERSEGSVLRAAAGSHFRVETMHRMTAWPDGDHSRLGLPLSRQAGSA